MDHDLNKAVDNVLAQTARNSQALAMLLEEQRERDGHLLALRLRMGRAPSYLVAASLGWVAQHVHFAGDLPIFREKGKTNEASKGVVIDAGTIDDIQQRRPDWRRQLQMTVYLATRPNRKFPPLLVVGYQGWVYEDPVTSESWGADERAMNDSVTATALEPKGVYYDLDVKDTNYYALDGQHRLMAILGLKELLDKGRLIALNQDGTPKKSPVIDREGIIEDVCRKTGEDEGVVHERLQRVMGEEHIGIEIIPAVVQGEKYAEARLRLRSVFVDVNENAKKPAVGESIMLDENDGFRIVARRVMVTHRLLKDGKVQQKQGQLSESSACYTTLQSLVEIAKVYLGAKEEFVGWKNPLFGDKTLGFMRPDEPEIEAATSALSGYFDALAELPSHIDFLQGAKAGQIRGEQDGEQDGGDNILFRPVVQVGLAKAIATLENERERALADIVRDLAAQERKGQLKLHNRESPWFGVLCDPVSGSVRRQKRHHDLCAALLIYLLGGGIQDPKARNDLREAFADARRVGDEGWVNADGDKTDSADEVQLPHLW